MSKNITRAQAAALLSWGCRVEGRSGEGRSGVAPYGRLLWYPQEVASWPGEFWCTEADFVEHEAALESAEALDAQPVLTRLGTNKTMLAEVKTQLSAGQGVQLDANGHVVPHDGTKAAIGTVQSWHQTDSGEQACVVQLF